MSEELKPCPFCGNENVIDADYGQEYWCACSRCGCKTGKFGNRSAADDRWNTRTELAAIKAGQGEAVACLVRSRHMSTPARLAHDGKDHFTPWGEWEPGTLAYGEAVTDAGRNTPCLYEMRPIYTAPPASADARLVPVELLERVVSQFEDDCKSFSYDIDDIRALLAQSESKGVDP